jgi:hypothetical protein
MQQRPTPNNNRRPLLPVLFLPNSLSNSAAPLEPPQESAAQCQPGLDSQPQGLQPSKHAAAAHRPSGRTRKSPGGERLRRNPLAQVTDGPRSHSEPPAGQQEASSPGCRGSPQPLQPRVLPHRIQEGDPPPATHQPTPSAATRAPGGRSSFLRSGPPRLTPRRLGALHAAGKPRVSPSLLHPAHSSKETEGHVASPPQVTEAPAPFDARLRLHS